MAASGDAGGGVGEFGEVLVRRGSIVVVNATPDRFDELERVQAAAYPTLAQSDLILATHLRAQHAAFAEGQHMAIDTETGRVVGMNCGLLTDSFDEAHPQHTFQGMTGGLMFTTHTPGGAWYYGADICVHPDCRGKGVGRMLYDARKAVARRHNCKGITSGGLIPGYCRHMAGHPKCGPEPLTAREYVSKGEMGLGAPSDAVRHPPLSVRGARAHGARVRARRGCWAEG